MGFRGACGFALAAALLGHPAAFASSGGITGVSQSGCAGCHSPSSFNYTGTVERFTGSVWTTSSTTVARSAALSIRFFLNYNSGTVAGAGGFNMSDNGGSLNESDAGIDQPIAGELTHTAPRGLSGNDINFNNITWTAPNSSGTFTIFACGQPVNNTGSSTGDGPHDCDSLAITVNNPPVIGNVANQAIQENGTTGALSFSVSDTETAAGSLTVTRSSSNTTVVPLANVVLGGSGGTRSVTATPAPNQFGSSTITITVTDGNGQTDFDTFVVTVNDQPAVSDIADQSTPEDTAIGPIAFTVGDGETAAGSLAMSGSSSNATLVPNGNIAFGGSGANRTVTITPATNLSGSTTITVTASDPSGGSGSDTFLLTVTSGNDPPTISAVVDQVINEDSSISALPFTIGDTESAATLLTLSGSSSNTTLVPDANIVFGGSGASRTVSVTSAPDQFGSATVTVTVSDPDGGSAQEPFLLTVAAINDAPVLSAIPDDTTEDFQLFSYQSAVTDADPGDTQSYGLTGAPAWLGISSGGLISGTPPIGTAGTFNITVTVTDGASASDSDPFVLTVTAPDSDSDGMPDSFENLHGFDPNDPADAAQDADGDGLSNLEEYQQGLDPTADDVAPVLNVPADLVVPATGYLTIVALGTATATDGRDGAVTPVSDWTLPVVRPGRYVVNWSATDQAGNVAAGTQDVDVLPLADFNADQVSGEGRAVNVTVTLNGTPPQYPAAFPYSLSGTAGAADSDAVVGTLTLTAGLSVTLPVAIAADGLAEGTEQLIFSLNAPNQAALGARSTHTITITDGNAAPVAALSGAQGAFPRLTAHQGDGLYTLTVLVSDPNDDAPGFDWSASADALGIDGAAAAQTQFDPSGLVPGAYPVSVTVSDGQLQASASLLVTVAAGTSVDLDIDADGIPDSLDAVTDYGALLEDQAGDPATAVLLEADAGLSLRRGRTSLAAGRTGALIAMSDIVTFGVGEGGLPLGADSFDNVGGIFDFEVHGLAPGGTARVVLPLQTAIREGGVYRKFDPASGWHDFVEDADNAVASAFSAFSQCPGPDSSDYAAGLQPFADCVRLTLNDGGPNDADGTADGVIRDPGGVAAVTATAPDTGSSVSSGAFLALWLPLAALLLRLRRRAAPALLALAALLAALPARADHHVRLHFSGDVASGLDNNVTNAQHDADIRESGFASVGGHMDYLRQLSLYTTLLLRGSGQYERWNSFDGLSNARATAMARMRYRADGDFYTPTLAAWVSAAAWEFDSEIRDSNEYRGGVFLSEHLTTQIDGRVALTANRRESEGLVFDLSGWSAQLNLDWVPVPHATVYTGYQYYDGDVTSTATPSLWIGLAAEAIEADDAFGGLAGGLRAYRLDATAHITTLGFNYALSGKMSLDFQGQYISTRADARNQYQRMVGVVSLLARF